MIYISKVVYKKLIGMEFVDCGIIYGKNILNNFFQYRSVIKKNRTFKVRRGEWVKVFLKFIFYKGNICYFHIHNKTGRLSREDLKNMIEGNLYLIVFKDFLFFYKKKNREIIELEYKII
jgi:hypothetical protein